MDRSACINILETYFEGLINNEVDSIPLHNEVTYSGPMLTAPLAGKERVYEFLVDVGAAFENVQYHIVRDIIDGEHVCSVVKLRLSEGQILDMCNIFEISQGEIKSIQAYYDPRPMLQ